MRVRAQSGFTLLEALIVTALLSVAIVKGTMVINSTTRSHSRESSAMMLEDQARRVLDQIGYAIMGSSRESLFPDPLNPFFDTQINYRVSMGVEAGEVIWNAPERIGLAELLTRLTWSENPGEVEERRVVWTNLVSPFLEGEVPNGVDDNGNGLIDESGISFSLEGDAVRIRLSLEKQFSDGSGVTETVETMVTCRN